MDKFRWSLETTETLINLKHSEESVRKFKFAQNNPRKTKECCDELALSFGNNITGKEIKTKYNQLQCLYRDVACKRKKSGGEAVFWKYWKVFDETFPRKEDDMLASNLEAIATDESYEVSLEDTVNNINKKKEESVTSLKNLKIKALEVYIKKSLKDEREPVNLIEIQEKINVLERKMDNTLELLKKLIEKDNK